MKSTYTRLLSISLFPATLILSVTTGLIAHENVRAGKAVFPNPFDTGTTFELTMPHAGRVKIDVYNIRGQHVRNLIDENREFTAGTFRIDWDGKDTFGEYVVPGVYVCTLQADGIPIKSVKAIKLAM